MSDGLVTVAEKYLKKGSKVYIEGKLESRKWTDKENQERYTTEVVLRPYSGELIMLDGRKGDVDQANLAPEPEQKEADAA